MFPDGSRQRGALVQRNQLLCALGGIFHINLGASSMEGVQHPGNQGHSHLVRPRIHRHPLLQPKLPDSPKHLLLIQSGIAVGAAVILRKHQPVQSPILHIGKNLLIHGHIALPSGQIVLQRAGQNLLMYLLQILFHGKAQHLLMGNLPGFVNLMAAYAVIVRFLHAGGISRTAHNGLEPVNEQLGILPPEQMQQLRPLPQSLLVQIVESGRQKPSVQQHIHGQHQPEGIPAFLHKEFLHPLIFRRLLFLSKLLKDREGNVHIPEQILWEQFITWPVIQGNKHDFFLHGPTPPQPRFRAARPPSAPPPTPRSGRGRRGKGAC